VPSFWQGTVSGVLLIVAVAIGASRRFDPATAKSEA